MAHILGKNKQQRFMQGMSLLLIVGSIAAIGVQLLYPSHAATGGATLSFSPASGTRNIGDSVSVTVMEDSGTTAITTVQADLSFSTAALQYNGVSATGSQFNDVAPAPSTSAGFVSITRGNATGVSGSQNFVTVNFTVLKAGTATIAFAPSSAIYTKADASDIYSGGTNANFTVAGPTSTPAPTATPRPTSTPAPTATPRPTSTPPPGTTKATLSLTPSSGTFQVGGTVSVAVYENSSSTAVTTVAPVVNFSSDVLQYRGIDDTGSQFAEAAPPPSTGAGTISFTRGSTTARTGNQKVTTLNFNVIKAGTATLSFTGGSAVYAQAGATNIYGSATGASYTLQGTATGNPPSPISGGGGGGTTSTTSSSPVLTYAAKGSSKAITVAGNAPLSVDQPFVVTPVLNDHVSSDGTLSPVVKVEYLLNNKSLAVITSEPFSYSVDTKHLRNGTYTLTVKTTYADGTTQSSSQKLNIKNPYGWTQFSLDAKHYAWISVPSGVLLLAGLGLAVAFLLRRRQWAFGLPDQGNASGSFSDPDLQPIVSGSAQVSDSPTISRIEPTVITPSVTESESDGVPFSSGMDIGNQSVASTTPPKPVTDVTPAPVAPAAPAPAPAPRNIPVFSANEPESPAPTPVPAPASGPETVSPAGTPVVPVTNVPITSAQDTAAPQAPETPTDSTKPPTTV